MEMEMIVGLFRRIHVSTVFTWKFASEFSELSTDGS
jgi:hypothetical protein